MLRVMSGGYVIKEGVPDWLTGKLQKDFDYFVDESWLNDDIVAEELRDVDDIVKIDGLMLTKSNGRRIPINWVSQGSKQFIYMTQHPEYVVDCRHVGWNVYKYFYKWAVANSKDVTMLMVGNGALNVDIELSGLYLNTGKGFSTNRELVNFIYKNKRVAWSVDKDREGYLAGRRYNVMEDDLGKKVIDYTGEIIRVKL